MTKPKCEICNDKRAKRKCSTFDGQFICPSCCAELRNDACSGCRYYRAAATYEASKAAGRPKEDFIIEISEEVEDAVARALALVEKGNFEKAQRMLQDLEKRHPRNHMVMYGLGTAYAFEENFDDAITYFEKAIQIFPYFAEAYYNLGAAYQKKLDLRRCVHCMRQVIEIGRDEVLVQKAEDMIRFLEEAVTSNSRINLDEFLKAQELFDAAFSQMEKGRWEQAIAGFQKCLKIELDHAQSYGNMGLCYAQLGERSKALAALDKALEIDPRYEPAMVNKAVIERIREGEPLTSQKMKSVEYYREYPLKNRSYLESFRRDEDRKINTQGPTMCLAHRLCPPAGPGGNRRAGGNGSRADPVEAIKFRMDQMGLNQKDLVPFIGSKSKVLNRKRPLTLAILKGSVFWIHE
ncbi:MAG: tetratricopeptide repeat protein [Deltaproteobacteria bacterium]|nr:tetratricopeptide repeat protein [Deltaproteobacteria bacterium]